MVDPIDLGWLAGIFDGEGCVHLLRTKRRAGTPSERVVPSIVLVITNTCSELIERCISILELLGVEYKLVLDSKHSAANQPVFYIKVQRKRHTLALAKILVEHTVAKRSQLQIVIWYLERACQVSHHVATEDEHEALMALGEIKKGRPVPRSVIKLLS